MLSAVLFVASSIVEYVALSVLLSVLISVVLSAVVSAVVFAVVSAVFPVLLFANTWIALSLHFVCSHIFSRICRAQSH